MADRLAVKKPLNLFKNSSLERFRLWMIFMRVTIFSIDSRGQSSSVYPRSL